MIQATTAPGTTTIVIAARLAAPDIERSLQALVTSRTDRIASVHVVCNGPVDDTAERAAGWVSRFEDRGWTLDVHLTDVVGKPAALRFGAAFRNGGGILVLDARVTIHPETLDELIAATENTELGIVSAQLNFVPVGGWVSQSFCRAYGASPYARSNDLKGTCIYFTPEFSEIPASMPDLASDDRYFVTSVKRRQRASIQSAQVDYRFPERAVDLIRQQTRWVRSNVEVDHTTGDYERNDHEEARRPYFGTDRVALGDRLVYFGVVAISRFISKTRRPLGGAW